MVKKANHESTSDCASFRSSECRTAQIPFVELLVYRSGTDTTQLLQSVDYPGMSCSALALWTDALDTRSQSCCFSVGRGSTSGVVNRADRRDRHEVLLRRFWNWSAVLRVAGERTGDARSAFISLALWCRHVSSLQNEGRCRRSCV
jgi:hypothetical protein